MEYDFTFLTKVKEYAKYINSLYELSKDHRKSVQLYPFSLKALQRKQRYLSNISKTARIRVFFKKDGIFKIATSKSNINNLAPLNYNDSKTNVISPAKQVFERKDNNKKKVRFNVNNLFFHHNYGLIKKSLFTKFNPRHEKITLLETIGNMLQNRHRHNCPRFEKECNYHERIIQRNSVIGIEQEKKNLNIKFTRTQKMKDSNFRFKEILKNIKL